MIYLPKLYRNQSGVSNSWWGRSSFAVHFTGTGLRFYYSGWHSWQIAPGIRGHWNHRMRQAQCYFHGWILKPVFLRPFVVCWACGCFDTTQNSVGCSMGMRYIAPGFWLARCCVRYDLTSDLWRNYNLAWCHKNVGKKPFGYIFTQFYTESFAMCVHLKTAVTHLSKQVGGVGVFPRGRPQSHVAMQEINTVQYLQSKLSF